MSSIGYRQLQLEQQRKEELRRKKIRRQARSLLKQCQKQIRSITNPAVQQIAAPQIRGIQQSLTLASNQIDPAPDLALQTIRDQQVNLNQAIARAEAEAERLRIQQVKDEANGLLTSSEAIIKDVVDPSIQQIAAEDLREIQEQIKHASKQIQSEPEQAKQQIAELQAQLRARLEKAQEKAEALSMQKAEAKARLESVRQSLEAQKDFADHNAKETLSKAETLIQEASRLYILNRLEDVSASCEQATTLIEQAGRETLAESERREVVGGLQDTLIDMGFMVESPEFSERESGNVIRLMGKMPSGKTAVFHISRDGKLDFDFDGYEGRTCVKDMEALEATLHERFSIQMGPAQVTWKNPDKIAKGAMNLPTAQSQTHY